MNEWVIIFSHGFGVQKDDRGLFTDIATGLPAAIKKVLFDYNEVDHLANTLSVRPILTQAKILKSKIDSALASGARKIIIVGHSQGCIVAAMTDLPSEVVELIFLAPPVAFDIERSMNTFKSRPGTVINLEGESRLARRDGSITIVPAAYWRERSELDVSLSYGRCAKGRKLVIIQATNDEVLAGERSNLRVEGAVQIRLSADHDFTGSARPDVVEVVRSRIVNMIESNHVN